MKLLLFGLLLISTYGRGQFNDPAYDEIGKRQKKFGAKEIIIPIDSQITDYKQHYRRIALSISDKTEVEIENKKYALPKTKFETIALRTHITRTQELANAVLKKYNIDTASVYFSFVLCPCFNAQSIPLENIHRKLKNKWLIEYNIGFSVLNQKASVFTANISPITGNTDSLSLDYKEFAAIVGSEENYGLYNSLLGFLLADIGSELNISSDSISLERCSNPIIAGSVSSGISDFTLYHELAHIILGHHAKINKMSISESDKADYIEVANFYEFEYAADSLGLEIMLEQIKDDLDIIKGIPTSAISVSYALSPLIFFSWLNIFQNFEDLYLGTHRGIATHPSAISRRERLQHIYEAKALINQSYNYADLVDGSLNYMYAIIRDMNSDELKKSVQQLRSKAKQCLIK